MLYETPQKVVLYSTCGGQTALNVMFGQLVSSANPTPTDGDVATALSTLVAPLMIGCLPANAKYWGLTVQQAAAPPNVNPVTYRTDGQGPGTFGTVSMASQVCGIFTKRTGNVGRKYRGRFYMPFPPIEASDGGAVPLPTAGYTAAVGVAAFSLTGIVVLNIGGTNYNWQWGLWTYRPAVSFKPTTSYIVRTKFATQRRRGSEGHPNSPPF